MAVTIGGDASRIDIDVYAGEPIDFTVEVLDGANAPVVDFTGWTLAASVHTGRGATVLHTLSLTGAADGVTVTAAAEDTAEWAGWAVTVARWDLWVTPPVGDPSVAAAGWVRVNTP
jgi:hypothetical protein